MRTLAIAAAIIAVAGPAAVAQAPRGGAAAAPAPVSTAPPKVLAEAGYTHREVTAAMCDHPSAKEATCTIPAMTAGPYVIDAAGASTATGAGAVQAINIIINSGVCNEARSNNTGQGSKPWTSGTQTIRVRCLVNVLTDTPLVIRATYADKNATTNTGSPTLALRALPWPGVLSAAPAGRELDQPKAK